MARAEKNRRHRVSINPASVINILAAEFPPSCHAEKEKKKVTEKKENKACEICGHPMTCEVLPRVFTCGPFDYHADALVYRCGCCGYEKLGTCTVQFWEDDMPPEDTVKTPDSDLSDESDITNGMTATENISETELPEEMMGTESIETPDRSDTDSAPKANLFAKITSLFQNIRVGADEKMGKPSITPEEKTTELLERISSESEKDSSGQPSDHPETQEYSDIPSLKSQDTEKVSEDNKKQQAKEEGKSGEEKGAVSEPGKEGKDPRPAMHEIIQGKRRISDEWMDYMLKHSVWYPWWYKRFVPKARKVERYLKSHIPTCQVIRDDVLYDTQTATMYLSVEKKLGEHQAKIYNYVTPAKKYFSITVIMGREDEFMIMQEKNVKKLLSEHPDIYRKVIDSDIIE